VCDPGVLREITAEGKIDSGYTKRHNENSEWGVRQKNKEINNP